MHDQPEPNVGRRIRALRERQGLSLRALARRSGLSLNAVTQIERGENSPTVSSLHLLAGALGVSIASFFEEGQAQQTVLVRPTERPRAVLPGLVVENLGSGLRDQRLTPFAVTLAPGMGSHEEPVSHPGEEFVYCLSGCVRYVIDGREYELTPGCSLLFDSAQSHYFRNHGDQPAVVLLLFYGPSAAHPAPRLHLPTAAAHSNGDPGAFTSPQAE